MESSGAVLDLDLGAGFIGCLFCENLFRCTLTIGAAFVH